MSLDQYVLNITEQNVRQYGREQYERDLEDGPSEHRKRNDLYIDWIQEHCMSGEVMEPTKASLSESNLRRLREFVANHLAHRKDAESVLPIVSGGSQVFVRLNGTLYHVRRSYASSPLEMPVVVSEATVIGD